MILLSRMGVYFVETLGTCDETWGWCKDFIHIGGSQFNLVSHKRKHRYLMCFDLHE